MKSIKVRKTEEHVLKAVTLPAEDLNNSLIVLRVANTDEVDEIRESLEFADVLSELENSSFLIVAGDIDVDIVKNGGATIVGVARGQGVTQTLHDDEDDEEVPF